MAIMGRPVIEIDKDQFEKLCGMFCTLVEISDFFDCSEDTIERWCQRTYDKTFAEIHKRKSSRGKMSVRRKQFEVAMEGNVTMLIWMGKNYLGQADKMSFVEAEGFDFSSDKV